MKLFSTLGTALAIVFTMAVAQANQDHAGHKQEGHKMEGKADGEHKVIADQLPSYPLETCVISGKPLGKMGDAKNVVVDGHLVRVCCGDCAGKVKADPKKYIETVRAAVIKKQSPDYPMETCPMTGEKLGAMGEPIQLVYGTRLVKLCCKGCVKSFHKNPAKAMEKINAAYIAKQSKTYKLKTCPVSGEELEAGETIDFLYGTKLVKVCCKNCVKAIKKNPAKYLAKVK